MAGITYKCPNCGGYLAFDPEMQGWKCPFCDSKFEESAVEDQQASKPKPEAEGQVVYRCDSCGSEIVTDETTVATHCYYCQSPVVLQGKMTSDMRPDTVLPFAIDKDTAVETFMKWVKVKRFVPKDFFSKQQVERMEGVYYPHFVTECEVEGTLDGEGRNVSIHSSSQYVITKTDHYHVRRAGRLTFRSILRPALSKANRKLSEGIHPFPLENEKPFSPAYLTGFLAERRDLEAASMETEIAEEVARYVEPLLSDSIHYDDQSVHASSRVRKSSSRYVLLPTWVLTYPNKKDKNDPYYYAMNGCTGEVCGKLPVDTKKLWVRGLIRGVVFFIIACAVCYFLL